MLFRSIVIMVVGCAVLTPVLLKLAFRRQPQASPATGGIAERFHKKDELERVSAQLLEQKPSKPAGK